MIDEDRDHLVSPDNPDTEIHNGVIGGEFIDSKERLVDIINFLPDATFVIDSAGRVIAWNRAMEEMTHVKADKMLGKGNYEYSIPFYGKRRKILIDLALSFNHEIKREYNKIRMDKSSITAEAFISSLNGRPTYLWGKATPLYDHKGEVVGAIESIRDITPQKTSEKELKKYHEHLEELVGERTEELQRINEKLNVEVEKREEIEKKLKRSEANYRSIFKHAGIGIFQSTPEGKFVNVNITMAHLFGFKSPKEMIKSIDKIAEDIYLNPSDRPENLRKIREGREIVKLETEFRRKNGEKWIADLNLRVVRDNEGNPLYFEGFVQDITSRKRTENALLESEVKYRTIFENTGAATLLIEKDTTVTLANSEFEKLSGYSKKDVEGKSWTELVFYDDLNKMMNYRDIRNLDPDSAPKNYEFRFIRKDKSMGYAYLNIVNIPGSTQRIASVVDITDRKNDEKKLYKLNKKLKRSNAELEQFAYVASHDLREPLRMITTFLQLLEKKYKDKLDEDANEYINYAVDGAKHLNAMINDLLEYARVAHQEIEFSEVDSEKVLENALLNLQSSLEENGASVTFYKLPKISGNENQLLQLFQNLIGNAIKYRGDEAPKIHVSAVKEGNEFVFSVKDNGIGMSEEHLERIFVIFQRLHTRGEYEGTGIGLAIAQKIVHQHGGNIWAESEPGNGTTFYFTLPV